MPTSHGTPSPTAATLVAFTIPHRQPAMPTRASTSTRRLQHSGTPLPLLFWCPCGRRVVGDIGTGTENVARTPGSSLPMWGRDGDSLVSSAALCFPLLRRREAAAVVTLRR